MEAKMNFSGALPFQASNIQSMTLRDGRVITFGPGDSTASSPSSSLPSSMPSSSPFDMLGGLRRPRGESFNSIRSSTLSQDSTRDITDAINNYTFDPSFKYDSNLGQPSFSNNWYPDPSIVQSHRPGTESDATQDALQTFDMQFHESDEVRPDPFPVIQDDVVRGATGGDGVFEIEMTQDFSVDSFNRAADVVQPAQSTTCNRSPGQNICQSLPLVRTGPIDVASSTGALSSPVSISPNTHQPRQSFASSPVSRSAQRHMPNLRSSDTSSGLDEYYRVHRRRPGRIPGTKLTEEARTKAKFQRYLGNCDRCKAGKRPVGFPPLRPLYESSGENKSSLTSRSQCDASTPCGPCRRQDAECHRSMMTSLINNILSDLRWAPYPRELSSWFPEGFTLGEERAFAFRFAAGRPIYHYVVRVRPANPSHLQHTHVVHTRPHQRGAHPATSYTTRQEFVLPVAFIHEGALHRLIDEHLDHLVNDEFLNLDLSVSRFVIRDKIYTLYKHYQTTNGRFASLLRNAMKLLVLVHLGDTTLDPNDGVVRHIIEDSPSSYGFRSFSTNFTPCILRAQLGKLQPVLARAYLRTVLSTLFELLGSRARDNHHVVLATYALVMSTLESIMYHGARPAFHEEIGDGPARAAQQARRGGLAFMHGREWSEWLLKLYRTCFENCHRKLVKSMGRVDEESGQVHDDFEDEDLDADEATDSCGGCAGGNSSAKIAPRGCTVPTQFLAALSEAITKANDYLEEKKGALDEVEDVSNVFDKLLAKLLLLN